MSEFSRVNGGGMIKIALVDDDESFVEQVNRFINRFMQETQTECVLSRYTNGMDFVSDYNPIYDIIFLDIEMPMMDGMETAMRLRQMDQDVPIIFVTNMMQMAIKGYEVKALDFMVKPITYLNFAQKLQKAIDYVQKNYNHNIVLKLQDGFKKMPIRDVKYVEVFGHSLIYHTQQGDIKVRGVLSQVESELESYSFLRCSNCFLVNLRYVDNFTSTSVEIGSVELPVSRRKKKEFTERLTDYLGGGR